MVKLRTLDIPVLLNAARNDGENRPDAELRRESAVHCHLHDFRSRAGIVNARGPRIADDLRIADGHLVADAATRLVPAGVAARRVLDGVAVVPGAVATAAAAAVAAAVVRGENGAALPPG